MPDETVTNALAVPETPEQMYERAAAQAVSTAGVALRRTTGLIGSFAAIWNDILPPVPEEVWRKNLAAVKAALEE